jgi:hypothetical protein
MRGAVARILLRLYLSFHFLLALFAHREFKIKLNLRNSVRHDFGRTLAYSQDSLCSPTGALAPPAEEACFC